jgi:hypothetical protein
MHCSRTTRHASRIASVLLVSLGLGLDGVHAVLDPATQFLSLVALARVRLVALADQIRLMGFGPRQQETGRAHRLEPQLHDALEAEGPVLHREVTQHDDADESHGLHDPAAVKQHAGQRHAA